MDLDQAHLAIVSGLAKAGTGGAICIPAVLPHRGWTGKHARLAEYNAAYLPVKVIASDGSDLQKPYANFGDESSLEETVVEVEWHVAKAIIQEYPDLIPDSWKSMLQGVGLDPSWIGAAEDFALWPVMVDVYSESHPDELVGFIRRDLETGRGYGPYKADFSVTIWPLPEVQVGVVVSGSYFKAHRYTEFEGEHMGDARITQGYEPGAEDPREFPQLLGDLLRPVIELV